MYKTSKKSKDKSSSSRNDDIDWDYDHPLLDPDRQQWYYEGVRRNGKKVKKYVKTENSQEGAGSQDTTVPRGNLEEITHGMGSLDVDDGYGGPQEYSFGGGGVPQETHRDGLSPTSTFPQTSGGYVPTTTPGTDPFNPNVQTPDAPYPEQGDYPLENQPYPPQHHRRTSEADQYPPQHFDDGSGGTKHHRSGKKDKGQRKGKGGTGGGDFPEDPFYGTPSVVEGYDQNQSSSYPPGQSEPDYSTPQGGVDPDYTYQEPTRESRRDKGKGRAAEHEGHSKHHRHTGHGGTGSVDEAYGSGSGIDPSQGQSGSYGGFPQEPYGTSPGGPLESIPELGTTGGSIEAGRGTGDQAPWSPDAPGGGDDYVDDDADDREFQEALKQSQAEYYGGLSGQEGGPSQARAYGAPPESPYPGYEGTQNPPSYYPQMSTSTPGYVSGTPGNQERLDPRFKVEPSQKFAPGEVFKVLWYEPKGSLPAGPPGGGSMISDIIKLKDHVENYFVGFRRFIVIANDEGHCTCVPILTYDRQGCNKKGAKPKKHGIIVEEGTKPKLLKNEPTLGFDPVRIKITSRNEKISRESRVNYSKLVTIEHNVKVFFIGHILPDDFDVVRDAVDTCWDNKDRRSHNRRRNRD